MNKRLKWTQLMRSAVCVSGCVVLLAGHAYQASAQDSEAERKQFGMDLDEIRSISNRKNLSDYDAEFDKQAAAVERKWAKKNKKIRAELMLELCNQISSGQYGKTRAHGLARKYALAALEDPESIPVETELNLVGHVDSNTTQQSEMTNEERGSRRRVEAKAKLHAWKRLHESIDPSWDPEDRPSLNVPLPAGANFPRGVAPEAIKDPKLRAEYEAAIEKNQVKARRYSEQHRLRNLRMSHEKRIERYLINAYSKPPLNVGELDELLKTHVTDSVARQRIMDAVTKQISERSSPSKVEPRTTPFRGHPKERSKRTKQAKPKEPVTPQ